MAKGSVRKKGKKWYYRFYVEDESGNLVQKEFVGTESKSETQAMLRKAMDDYESKKFIAKSDNLTLGDLLDIWIDEDLKLGSASNGTVMAYQGAVKRIKKHPIGKRKLKTITADHLQAYMDLLCFGDENNRALSTGYIRQFAAVLQGAFRFAVFPKRFISFNPMQYVVQRQQNEECELFADGETEAVQTISVQQFTQLTEYLKNKDSVALLPIQIAYYTGLRIGEVCGLTWQDIDLKEQHLTVRRSIRYNGSRHKTEIGTTKSKKIRTVDFGDTLKVILQKAKKEQMKNRLKYGELYSYNCYTVVKEKNRKYYEVYTLPNNAELPENYKRIDFVCTKPDGAYIAPHTIDSVCKNIRNNLAGFDNFHFHLLRHTYASNLLANGASPKDIQELLGHASATTSVEIYGHSTREAKRTCVKSLDALVGA